MRVVLPDSQKMPNEVCGKILPDFARTLREDISEAMDAKFNFLLGNMRETTMQVSTNAVKKGCKL